MAKTERDPFETALENILRPVAAAMIDRGVTIGQATEILKRALLEAAEGSDGGEKRPSDSRISLLTGLHRKDVRRLRDAEKPAAAKTSLGACALIAAVWSNSDDFTDDEGRPRILPRLGGHDRPGFDTLFAATKIDLPLGTVLTALIERGMVAFNEDGTAVELKSATAIGPVGSPDALIAFEKNVVAHLNAAVGNLLSRGDTPLNFERALHYNNLSCASVNQLEKRARQQAQALLVDLDEMAFRLQSQDDEADVTADQSFSLGSYINVVRTNDDAGEG